MLYKCKQCGTKFNIPDERLRPEGSRFRCTKCGTSFVLRRPSAAQATRPGGMACPRCRGLNRADARFCSNCGTPLTSMPPAPVKKKKINPHLFAFPMWGSIFASLVGGFVFGDRSLAGVLLMLAAMVGFNFAAIYGLIALYRCWSVIRGPEARTSPGRAVGFLFIPLFNLYWIFVAVRGLAVDANAFLKREGINGNNISVTLSLLFCILYVSGILIAFVFPPAYLIVLVLHTILVYQWAGFNNTVIETPQYARRQAQIIPQVDSAAIVVAVIVAVFVGIAVLGILAAIAIPAFLGQREKARMRMLESNYNMAISVVREELEKCGADRDSVTTEVVAQLNAGGTSNPWFPESDAFSSSFGKGQVSISHKDLRSLCGKNSEVVIMADNRGDGIEDEEFIKSIRVLGSKGSALDLPRLERRNPQSGQIGL
jgi:predicted Zn finger-like uncharacterized protein